jgi:hypothetical protein
LRLFYYEHLLGHVVLAITSEGLLLGEPMRYVGQISL